MTEQEIEHHCFLSGCFAILNAKTNDPEMAALSGYHADLVSIPQEAIWEQTTKVVYPSG